MSDVSDWWRTGIIDMEPGRIAIRGEPIEDLINDLTFVEMVWLMLRGERPQPGQARLLEAALVSAVDHGPQSPAIAASRMAVTCGLAINNALAVGVNMLGDVHGGAGAQAVMLFEAVAEAGGIKAVPEVLDKWRAENGPFVPGFGHRFHKPEDPRAPVLLAKVDEAAAAGVCSGDISAIAKAVQAHLIEEKGKPIPINIDGATAVIFAELGFDASLARGLFCLSRSVGLLAHSHEQSLEGARNKGPTPPEYRWTYDPGVGS